VVALDLQSHEVVAEHNDGRTWSTKLTPDRAVGEVTREALPALRDLVGDFEINPTPQEVPWSAPLDEDSQHAHYDRDQAGTYFAAATQAALVLAAFRAPYRGRSTPVNAWWGSFDLAINLYSGSPADPPRDDFITRNSMDVQEIAIGWWPGDGRYGKMAFFAYAHPAPPGFPDGSITPPAARWSDEMGLFLLDWDDVASAADPRAFALEFARSAYLHACLVCGWDPALAASGDGKPPPVH
jgi:hypothetical protein